MQVRKVRWNGTVSRMDRDDELLEAFATELRVRRTKEGYSQESLALLAGVNRTYIAKLESAKNQPTLCVLHNLAIALDVDLADLIQSTFVRYNSKDLHSKKIEEIRETPDSKTSPPKIPGSKKK